MHFIMVQSVNVIIYVLWVHGIKIKQWATIEEREKEKKLTVK